MLLSHYGKCMISSEWCICGEVWGQCPLRSFLVMYRCPLFRKRRCLFTHQFSIVRNILVGSLKLTYLLPMGWVHRYLCGSNRMVPQCYDVVKVLVIEHHAMKVCWGSRGIAPHIPDLGIRWRWVVSFMPQLLFSQGKSPQYPLDRRLGRPQSWSGHSGEVKNSWPSPGLKPLIMQPIVQHCTTRLLLYIGCKK
jgi:hypothetical protein